MPATAGRVRMPFDNRLSVSDSLKTSEIWQKSVGYDPYSPTNLTDGARPSISCDIKTKSKELFALAKLTGSATGTTPGACKKCNQVGHLAYQCRNDVTLSSLIDNHVPTTQNPVSVGLYDTESDSSSSDFESSLSKKKPSRRSHGYRRNKRRGREISLSLSRSSSSCNKYSRHHQRLKHCYSTHRRKSLRKPSR